ncbi:hypothetical protein MVEN_01998700 [Mycena venus]|uniref:Uncharacterized protein n=1 Tax=Mycena venus TaxID=2733690 RepID=A0A8H6XDA2_9AGAR|nr:hypothetical protein MVEN_01998700 [Mycena venus]
MFANTSVFCHVQDLVNSPAMACTVIFVNIPMFHHAQDPHNLLDSLLAFIDFTFPGWKDIIITIPFCLSITIAICIVFVSTAERSKKPITLVHPTIHLLRNRPDFGNRNKLIHQLVHIVMENVDSLWNM